MRLIFSFPSSAWERIPWKLRFPSPIYSKQSFEEVGSQAELGNQSDSTSRFRSAQNHACRRIVGMAKLLVGRPIVVTALSGIKGLI
ncbi:MAG: hypothetical protein WD648_11960 [Planctomycetaceae bacterium]